jgi:hypothetical protein
MFNKKESVEEIFKHKMINQNVEEYICLTELVDEGVLMFFAQMAEEKSSQKGIVDSIVQIANRVYVKMPTLNENPESLIPSFGFENFNKEFRDRFGDVQQVLNYGAVKNAKEDFPVLIDMFEVQKITFAFELQNKQNALESALDYMVEIEDYETAAELKPILQDMDSNKIHQN